MQIAQQVSLSLERLDWWLNGSGIACR